MQIVIEIAEEEYKQIINNERCMPTFISQIIKNGTPLPKGHGDLKDADVYKAEVDKYIAENKSSDDLYLAGCGDGAYHALHTYNCIPTIIKADGGEEG